jgi:hypothetical protein
MPATALLAALASAGMMTHRPKDYVALRVALKQHKAELMHFQGVGFWPSDTSYPPLGYQPGPKLAEGTTETGGAYEKLIERIQAAFPTRSEIPRMFAAVELAYRWGELPVSPGHVEVLVEHTDKSGVQRRETWRLMGALADVRVYSYAFGGFREAAATLGIAWCISA